MKCLHICNDFLGSKVHENLYEKLDALKIEQTVFFPLRKSTINQQKEKEYNYNTIASTPIKLYHRILFRSKINHLYNDLKADLKTINFDIVHATTLLSDGAMALRLKKEFKIPYIVTVRSTDIDVFFKYRPDLINLAKQILAESSKIIFISNVLKNKFLKHPSIRNNQEQYASKSQLIYNGIDEFWLNNQVQVRREIKPTKILFVGKLSKRKNVDKLIHAVILLNKQGVQCELTIVGTGSLQKEVEELAQQHQPIINYIGFIKDKPQLKKVYDSHHLFALPSQGETFGLVYLEALSQGLPILYVKNDGIDGLFDFPIGEKCDKVSVPTIASNLEKMMIKYPEYEIDRIDFSAFSWNVKAQTYIDVFHSILSE